ncbi:putative reverse transcriptase domain-containing protein [Tanacetum coccineum]
MTAGVAVVNGHTDKGHKLRSLVNSFRHGKKTYTSSAGFDLRPIFGISRSNVNEGILGGDNMKTTQADDSIRQFQVTMSSRTRSLIVAGTVGLVEALKDQGFARWNYTIRTIHHHAKSNIRSVTQSKKLSSQAAMASSRAIDQSEESLRKVMYLSCWGPN